MAFALAATLAVAVMGAACSPQSPSGTAATSVPSPLCTPPPATAGNAAPAPWLAPPNPMALAGSAGLVPETAESLQYHVHAHLDVFVDGVHQTVPAGIGINTQDRRVHCFVDKGQASFGAISVRCAQPCISPLHTHDVSGVLHTESATTVDNTLGQFFTEWGVRLTADCVGGYCRPATPIVLYLNGKQQPPGDPSAIALSDMLEIAIVVGQPPSSIPSSY